MIENARLTRIDYRMPVGVVAPARSRIERLLASARKAGIECHYLAVALGGAAR